MADRKKNKGVYVCKGKRIHVAYNDITLHFDFNEFEKFTFMIDDAYHHLKGRLNYSPGPDDNIDDDST